MSDPAPPWHNRRHPFIMNGASLLSRFAEVATSPLALAAYFIAISAWVAAAYMRMRLTSKANAILGQYRDDDNRLKALLALSRDPSLGPLTEPRHVIAFVKMRDKQQRFILILVAFGMLVAATVIVTAILVMTRENIQGASIPPVNATGSVDVGQPVPDSTSSTTTLGTVTANPSGRSLSEKERIALMLEYQNTERRIREFLRPPASNPDPRYITDLHVMIRRNREIASRIGDQDSWPAVGVLIEQRLPGTLEQLGYPIPEE
jgi:hypothetical protein